MRLKIIWFLIGIGVFIILFFGFMILFTPHYNNTVGKVCISDHMCKASCVSGGHNFLSYQLNNNCIMDLAVRYYTREKIPYCENFMCEIKAGDYVVIGPKERLKENPIQFVPADLQVKVAKTETVQISFYNTHPTYTQWTLEILDEQGKCGGLLNQGTLCSKVVNVTYNDAPFLLEKEKLTGWNVVFEPLSGSTDGKASKPYLFTVRFCADGTQTPSCNSPNAEIVSKELLVTVRK